MGERGCAGRRGKKGEKWNNCNSIINKIYFKRRKNNRIMAEGQIKIQNFKIIRIFIYNSGVGRVHNLMNSNQRIKCY